MTVDLSGVQNAKPTLILSWGLLTKGIISSATFVVIPWILCQRCLMVIGRQIIQILFSPGCDNCMCTVATWVQFLVWLSHNADNQTNWFQIWTVSHVLICLKYKGFVCTRLCKTINIENLTKCLLSNKTKKLERNNLWWIFRFSKLSFLHTFRSDKWYTTWISLQFGTW